MKPDFLKYADGLIPVIIQDAQTSKVLMLGFMNQQAYDQTVQSGRVTFYSRSRQALWTKGETSGHFLDVREIRQDCDRDTLLIRVNPHGPVCHTGSDTCFGEENQLGLLERLEKTIHQRFENKQEGSYVSSLAGKGINKIAQKVGEEAVELVIEAKDNDPCFLNEGADLLFHFLVLLRAKGFGLQDVLQVLASREK